MESSWQDPELRFLLGEMIKASSVDVPLIAEFIKANNIEQNWLNMQLPIGRTMQQCMGAAERVLSVVHHPQHPNFYPPKRKSPVEISDQPLKRQVTIPPAESAQPPRNIQPRPISNGYTPTPTTSSNPSAPSTGTGKKRGRPSKADKEAQARASSFRTMEYAPITPAPAPAPLGPMNLAPQREYASSPSYEITGSTAEGNAKKRGKLSVNEKSPTVGYYPVASPAPVPDAPRGPTEFAEQANQTQPPRDHGEGHPAINRASPFHTPLRHSSPFQAQPQPQSHAQSNTLPPIQSGPRPASEHYRPEHPRIIDPIFPDRDRSRSGLDPISRSTPPAPSPVANRG